MARVGNFQGAATQYGQPLSYVVPPDNSFKKALYDPALLDPRLHLTNKQLRDLQAEVDQIYSLQQLVDQLNPW